jgi:hypothetical protein
MFRQQPGSCALLSLVAAVLLAGCGQPHVRPAALVEAERPLASLASLDAGADMLADVDNARAAIAGKDALAADNDVIQASSFAVGLPDRASTPHPNEANNANPGGAQPSPAAAAGLTAFQAEVMLTTAQSQLERGDLAGADEGLAAIQQRTPTHLAPVDMPLLRADQSLGLARIANVGEYPAELRTQLTIAEISLDAYRGGPHTAAARALAAAIDRSLKQPGALQRLQPDQLGSWSGRVDNWG